MYQSDLTIPEWSMISHYFEPSDPRGRKPIHSKLSIVNAIMYVVEGGIKWRMLPHDFPKWQTVYDYYRQWNRSGLWDKVLCALNKAYRLKKSRNASPSYAILDTQSVKTRYCGEERGYDGGKKDKGSQKANYS
jgi:putative transposase